ncbi:hypothetical protein [Marinagarivorans algicola]|uniref:hypothetical protein n=1 Tax=Marinagarivorans algicola TaxID=1513270 RepID=UPI0006B949C1|nr:hypothetical protein [Marinagarivorans algicola]
MKKILLASLMALPSSAFADFIGIHGEIGTWHASFKGKTAAEADKQKRDNIGLDIPSFKERGFEEDNQIVGWVAFEHPLPFIPNIRIAYLGANSEAISEEPIVLDIFKVSTPINGVPSTITFQDQSRIITEMNLDSLDGTLYWELLDNWVNLDIGFTIRKLDGSFDETVIDDTFLPLGPINQLATCDAQNWPRQTVPGNGLIPIEGCVRPGFALSSSTPIDLVIPLLYSKLQLDLPFSGLFAAATLQGMSFDGSSMVDIDVEVGYMFDLTIMELGASIGYRRATLEANNLESLYADTTLEGAHLNIKLHF